MKRNVFAVDIAALRAGLMMSGDKLKLIPVWIRRVRFRVEMTRSRRILTAAV